jgi:hypothetical protein
MMVVNEGAGRASRDNEWHAKGARAGLTLIRVEDADGLLSLLRLPNLVELKLASGISAPHRLMDLADVLEVIRA